MLVNSYLEIYTTLFSWVMYDAIWDILNGTGLVYIPLIGMVWRNMLIAHSSGAGHGNAGVLAMKRIEVEGFFMVLVIVLVAMPTQSVNIDNLPVKIALCTGKSASVDAGAPTKTTFDHVKLDGITAAKVPIWWALVHQFSVAAANAAIDGIPCQIDYSKTSYKIEHLSIHDTSLQKEVSDFAEYCYIPARSKLDIDKPTGLSANDIAGLDWLGSTYFLDTGGYYDSFYKEELPVSFDTCAQWWDTANTGLSARLLSQVDTTLFDDIKIALLDLVGGDPSIIEQMAQHTALKSLTTLEEVNYWRDAGTNGSAAMLNHLTMVNNRTDSFAMGVGGLGTSLGWLWEAPKLQVFKELAPHTVSLVLMMVIILLPIVIVFGGYRLKVVLLASVGIFSLQFMDFVFAICHWVENQLWLSMVAFNSEWASPSLFVGGATTAVIAVGATLLTQSGTTPFEFLAFSTYIIFPMVYAGVLAWAGYQIGSFIPNSASEAKSSSQSASAGTSAIVSAAGAAGGAVGGVGGAAVKGLASSVGQGKR